MAENNKKLSRKEFFRVGGSTVAGLTILGVAGNHLYKMIAHPERAFYGEEQGVAVDKTAPLPSPYRKVAAFKTSGAIAAFELYGDVIYVASERKVLSYNLSGKEQKSFVAEDIIRDIAIYEDKIYLLHPTKIAVYSLSAERIGGWEACSFESDYCQMTVFEGGVFVTDAANKNICKYTLNGAFRRFIDSPEGFIVPSYSFGITNIEGVVYCSNPGRHKVESYTAEGDFIASFGQTGNAEGSFSGCCNPVHLTSTASGDIITSEKGLPRISCYGRDGKFHATLLSREALGVGHDAREVRVVGDRMIVAGGDVVSIFQYDEKFAEATACGSCEKDCPLKRGINI